VFESKSEELAILDFIVDFRELFGGKVGQKKDNRLEDCWVGFLFKYFQHHEHRFQASFNDICDN
jgi:hypothetical protein